MSNETCSLFQIGNEPSHQPSQSDLVNGFPKNSIPSQLRICLDSRKSNCVYYKEFIDTTESYEANLSLCLYGYRTATD